MTSSDLQRSFQLPYCTNASRGLSAKAKLLVLSLLTLYFNAETK